MNFVIKNKINKTTFLFSTYQSDTMKIKQHKIIFIVIY